MTRVEIVNFKITDQALDHASWHGIGIGIGIGIDQIFAVLDREWVVTPNRGGRAASHILYGTDNQGQCIAMPIARTEVPGVWRPITAWYCKKSEAAILRQRKPR